jgi:UDP-N-acetylglucosamine--N-acetylmuramyl-(pentapeptide) pyrophosphoryl-undecaprenol N-acetylglucosamine transferase
VWICPIRMKPLRVIIAAGGTGGHVFPALALAEEIRDRFPDAEILFVGTHRGLEEKVIPANGFKLKMITMSGLIRSFAPLDVLQNLVMPLKLFFGIIQSWIVLIQFKPQIVVGCGGYVSGPIVLLAAWMGKKTLVQEQNSRPGRTTLILAQFVDEVHGAYEEVKAFFKNQQKLKISGNPLRKGLQKISRHEACKFFGLDQEKKILLVIGGSLGAHAINVALMSMIDSLSKESRFHVLWQTGKNDFDWVADQNKTGPVRVVAFIDDMSKAYSCADLVLCRAGAMTISEITMMGLPAIFVPYPHAANNHQEFNARSLVNRGAAVMIRNSELPEKLKPVLFELLTNAEKLKTMSQYSFALRQPESAKRIVDSIITLVNKHD